MNVLGRLKVLRRCLDDLTTPLGARKVAGKLVSDYPTNCHSDVGQADVRTGPSSRLTIARTGPKSLQQSVTLHCGHSLDPSVTTTPLPG